MSYLEDKFLNIFQDQWKDITKHVGNNEISCHAINFTAMIPFRITWLILVGQSVCGGGGEDNDKEEQVALTQRNTTIRWACT